MQKRKRDLTLIRTSSYTAMTGREISQGPESTRVDPDSAMGLLFGNLGTLSVTIVRRDGELVEYRRPEPDEATAEPFGQAL